MASNIHFTIASLNGFLDTINTRLGSNAKLKFYTGTQPANADAALSGNTLLGTLLLTTPSPFGAAASRVITAAAITSDSAADATGTATWATFTTSADVRVIDCTVGEAADSADITVNAKAFVTGANIAVTSFTLTLPA